MKRLLLAAISVALVAASCLFAVPALAETTVTLPTIDFAPIKELALEALTGVLMALATWISWKVKNVLKLKEDSEVRVYLDKALENAAHYAIQTLRDKTANLGTIEVKNQMVAIGANYALKYVPDALAHFGVKPEDLQKMVEARLGKLLGSAAPDLGMLGPAPAAVKPAA